MLPGYLNVIAPTARAGAFNPPSTVSRQTVACIISGNERKPHGLHVGRGRQGNGAEQDDGVEGNTARRNQRHEGRPRAMVH